MLFCSVIFIYIFLPIVTFLYLITKKEWRNAVLLIASIVFYAWGELQYLVIIFLTILINFFGAIIIDKIKNHKKLALSLVIVANLSFLIYFKYFNFIIENINNIFNSNLDLLHVILPLGISFYTFQALSYVIDVFRGTCKVQKNIYKLSLFICLFPQLIAGPIIKYKDIEEQLDNREENFEKIYEGFKRFIIGLSKKVIIADTLGIVVNKIFEQSPDTFSPLIAWLGAFGCALQLYFDFSGYSDMAIGLGLIFGFRFMENFNYPYISKSISEFWKRWHISLSTWFKQYVYIPLGSNKNGLVKTCRNLGIVFLLAGIWHGAAWNFILWGVWYGFFIIVEKIIDIKDFELKHNSLMTKILQHIYCIFVVVTGIVIFRADSMGYAVEYIKNMFGLLQTNDSYFLSYYIDIIGMITFITAILCSTPLFKNLFNVKTIYAKFFMNAFLIFLFIFSTAKMATSTVNPFIYFRF